MIRMTAYCVLGLLGLGGGASAISAAGAGEFQSTVTVHLEHVGCEISPLIYGQYLEHVQRDDECIYPSIWDGESTRSNAMGLRTDVIAAAADMRVPVVRWPGGCFADVYHWEDGIGPRAQRPVRPNLHWGGTEPNQFGTDEFLAWCGLANIEPYINVNLGSGTLDEALRWLEYCNGAEDTAQGRRRAANGRQAPYGVKYWGIGNETWGHWETGHTDADTYGRQLKHWAAAMRTKDPTIRILGVGSEEGNDPEWDQTVLEHAGGEIDLLTTHMYGVSTEYTGAEYEAFVYTPDYLEWRLWRLVELIDKYIDESGSSGSRSGPIRISIDEWNIRHFYNGKQNRKSPRNLQDALFTAAMLNAMIRLSPKVEMANYVFLVNGNGTMLVDADQVVKTPLAHVFRQYAYWMTGSEVRVEYEGPLVVPPDALTGHPGRKVDAKYREMVEGVVPAVTDILKRMSCVVDVAAAHDGERVTVSLVNRDRHSTAAVVLELGGKFEPKEQWLLTHSDIYAVNTFGEPEEVLPVVQAVEGRLVKVPPHSVMLVRCGR